MSAQGFFHAHIVQGGGGSDHLCSRPITACLASAVEYGGLSQGLVARLQKISVDSKDGRTTLEDVTAMT